MTLPALQGADSPDKESSTNLQTSAVASFDKWNPRKERKPLTTLHYTPCKTRVDARPSELLTKTTAHRYEGNAPWIIHAKN